MTFLNRTLTLFLTLLLLCCWGCGDPPNSVMEMVLPDKDMPAAEEPAVTMADVKTTPADEGTAAEEQPPADEPPVTMETEAETEPPPPIEPEMPELPELPELELPDLGLIGKMEAILASKGEVHSPIPDEIYELLWGNWTKAGNAEPRRFYTRYIDAEGIAIVGSKNVDDRTLQLARHIVLIMTSKLPGLREALAVTTPDPHNATDRFRLVLYNPDVEDPSAMPEIQQGGEVLGGFFGFPMAVTPLEAGKRYTSALSQTLMHEMAHAIEYALTFHPHVFPGFRVRLDSAWERQQEHFRLREEDERPFTELDKLYPICHAKDSYSNVSVLEWWATYIGHNWFDEFFEPLKLQNNPNYEHLELEKFLCGEIVNLADEIFPRYSVNTVVIDRYED